VSVCTYPIALLSVSVIKRNDVTGHVLLDWKR